MRSKPKRLFVNAPLRGGAEIELAPTQAHYVIDVLRCKAGDHILLFNGQDGEWRGELSARTKRHASLLLSEQTRPQDEAPDLHYLFAPLKRARLDYMAQKATEMGASRLRPVITRRTMPERVNLERLLANATEAAEQCGLLHVPEVSPPETLDRVLESWDPARLLIFADEAAPLASPLAALKGEAPRPLALLIGPEGGFDAEERATLIEQPFVLPIALGPRVMRADTAAVAALALINAALGDWR